MTEKTCVWDSTVLAKSGFCEDVICGLIAQPANTWTNIAFFIVGYLLFRIGRKQNHVHISILGAISVAIGLGSIYFHMTGTYIGVVFDYSGMVLASAFSVSANLRRWLGWSFRWLYILFFALFAVWIGVTLLFPGKERYVFGIGSMICCLIELRLFLRDSKNIKYKYYLLSWLCSIIGFVFWQLDINKILCDPANHFISPHGVWHLMMALSVYFVGKYLLQFRILRRNRH